MKIQQMIEEKRIGNFVMSEELLDDLLFSVNKDSDKFDGICTKVFGKIFIVNAMHDTYNRIIRYTAYSEEFDKAENIVDIPRYKFIISKEVIENDNGEPEFTFYLTIEKVNEIDQEYCILCGKIFSQGIEKERIKDVKCETGFICRKCLKQNKKEN